MRKTVNLPSMSSVVAGSKATLEVPVGPTYKNIIFSATGTALAAGHIKRISVYLDGKLVQTFENYTRLAALNAYYNRGADTVNQFVLHFFRAEMMDAVYRRAPGIGTANVQTFNVEIELDATAPADITMTAHAEIDPVKQPLGVFMKVREYPFSSSVAGEIEVDKLPRGAFYAAVHLFKADVSAVEVEANQVLITKATKSILERTQKEAAPVKRVPQTAAATHIDFVNEGDFAQAIKTDNLQDFRIRATLDTSGSMPIVTETLDTLHAA